MDIIMVLTIDWDITSTTMVLLLFYIYIYFSYTYLNSYKHKNSPEDSHVQTRALHPIASGEGVSGDSGIMAVYCVVFLVTGTLSPGAAWCWGDFGR